MRPRAEEVVASVPGAIISHESAAELLGIPHLASSRMRRNRPGITITTPLAMHERGLGYRTVAAPVPASQVVNIEGLRVTSPIRTAVDIARMSSFPAGLAVVDAVAREMISANTNSQGELRELVREPMALASVREGFQAVTGGMWKWYGIARARRAIARLNAAAESVLESVSRAAMIEAELPLPCCGEPYRTAAHQYWLDFYWEEYGLGGEADGAVKYEAGDGSVLFAEKRREDDLRASGLEVIRWTWHDTYPNPAPLLQKLTHAFDRAGRRYGI